MHIYRRFIATLEAEGRVEGAFKTDSNLETSSTIHFRSILDDVTLFVESRCFCKVRHRYQTSVKGVVEREIVSETVVESSVARFLSNVAEVQDGALAFVFVERGCDVIRPRDESMGLRRVEQLLNVCQVLRRRKGAYKYSGIVRGVVRIH